MAGALGLAEIKAAIQSIREAGEQLKLNANSRLVLEALMLNLPRSDAGQVARQKIEVKYA